jgi:predicted nucleic acid-binding protein
VLVEEGFVSERALLQDWIIVKQVEHQEKVNSLLNRLDLVESEAIVLGLELRSDFLLIDEKAGRLIAVEKQIKTIGTLGILLESKRQGLISSVSKKMDHLREIGFWISDSLYAKIVELEKQM